MFKFEEDPTYQHVHRFSVAVLRWTTVDCPPEFRQHPLVRELEQHAIHLDQVWRLVVGIDQREAWYKGSQKLGPLYRHVDPLLALARDLGWLEPATFQELADQCEQLIRQMAGICQENYTPATTDEVSALAALMGLPPLEEVAEAVAGQLKDHLRESKPPTWN